MKSVGRWEVVMARGRAVFGRWVQTGWEGSTVWAIMARKGIYLAGVE